MEPRTRPPINTFSNTGKPWTAQEVSQLLREAKERVDFPTIASRHSRSEYACKCKVYTLAKKRADLEKRSLEEVCSETGLDYNDVVSFEYPDAKKIAVDVQQSTVADLLAENNRLLRDIFSLLATINEENREILRTMENNQPR